VALVLFGLLQGFSTRFLKNGSYSDFAIIDYYTGPIFYQMISAGIKTFH
jgi:hypothetical protein